MNKITQMIIDVQSQLKSLIKNCFLQGISKTIINQRVQVLIRETVREIPILRLKNDTIKSLNVFAENIYRTLVSGINGNMFALILTLNRHNFKSRLTNKQSVKIEQQNARLKAIQMGVPLQEYSKNYEDKVKKIFDKIIDMQAKDINDLKGYNTLHNLAEMEVRYNEHIENIESLKASGIKLVISSVHADCSDRCFPFQGRVYSLDGTYGETEDGKKYEPLEKATDIYYTTKAGRTYKNGLLGFNCRHRLYEYKAGMVIPKVSKEEQQKQRKVNDLQREYERRIRILKDAETMFDGIDNTRKIQAKIKRKRITQEYKSFSKGSERAYYPERIKIN